MEAGADRALVEVEPTLALAQTDNAVAPAHTVEKVGPGTAAEAAGILAWVDADRIGKLVLLAGEPWCTISA